MTVLTLPKQLLGRLVLPLLVVVAAVAAMTFAVPAFAADPSPSPSATTSPSQGGASNHANCPNM